MNKSNKVFFLFLCFITGLAFAAPEVESVAISGDKLIVTGHKFLDIDGLTLSDPQTGFKKPFKVESATESEIVGTAVDNQKITVASLMNLIIDTAKGETTYPVSFSLQKDAVTNPTIKNGAITPEKFVGVTTPNPPDQSVLTWNEATQSFIFTSPSGGDGSGGVSDIVLGAGITGAPNTASGSVPISVDIGATGNTTKTKIPYFNSKNKIVLDSTTSPVGSLTGLSFKDGTQNFYMFNDNGLRVNSNAASDLLVMGVDGNLFLKGPVTVGGYDVCLSSGNCTSAPSGTSTVTATAPLIAATNSTGTTNISAGAVNTANNLVQLDAAGKFPATIPGVVRGPGTVTAGTLAVYSNTTGENLGNSGIGLQNLVTMPATPTTGNKIVISTGANRALGTTAYTIPNTSGVTGQILALTATDTAGWIDSPASGVTSFKTRTGAVVPVAGDYSAAQVTNLPLGVITGTTVQQAIDQLANLDSQKLPKAGGTMTGTLTTSTQNALKIGPYASGTGEVQFLETAVNGTNFVGFKSPASIASNTVWTLPVADGTSGQLLSTNGSKVLSWTSAGAGGAGDVVGPPTSTANNLATYSDATGKIIKDSGINSGNLPTMATAATAANKIIISAGANKQLSTTLYPIPAAIGASGTVLKSDGTNVTWQTDFSGTGDVIGSVVPTVANRPALYADTTGKILKEAPFTLPLTAGTTGQVLGLTGMGTTNWVNPGDVIGAATSTTNAIPRFTNTSGKNLSNSGVVINSSNEIAGFTKLISTGPFVAQGGGKLEFYSNATKLIDASQGYVQIFKAYIGNTGGFTVGDGPYYNLAVVGGGKVGINTGSPYGALDITSTTSGFLPPRMTTTQKEAMVTQMTGTVVFDTTLNSLNVKNSTGWASLGSGTGNVVGPATSTLNNFATFSDAAGKIIKDSGINSGNLPTMATAATAANKIIISSGANKQLTTTLYPIPAAIGASGTVLKSDGTNVTWQTDFSNAGDVKGPATTAANRPALYADTSGKLIKEAPYTLPLGAGTTGQVLGLTGAGIANWVNTGNVVGAATSTTNAIATFAGTDGKTLKNSAFTINGTTLQSSIASIGENSLVEPSNNYRPWACFARTGMVGDDEHPGFCQNSGAETRIFAGSTFELWTSGKKILRSEQNHTELWAEGSKILYAAAAQTSHYGNFFTVSENSTTTNFFTIDTKLKTIGIGTSLAPKSILEINSTTSGFLPPRMTTAQKDAIVSPTPGMVVFDATLNALNVRTSTGWMSLASGTGDVVGPPSSKAGGIAVFATPYGKTLTGPPNINVNSTYSWLGIGAAPQHVLHIDSTTSGVLFPRMTTVQKEAITPQSTGLVVFDTTLQSLSVKNTYGWMALTGDVAGPATSTVYAIPIFGDTSGKRLTIPPVPVTINGFNDVVGIRTLSMNGSLIVGYSGNNDNTFVVNSDTNRVGVGLASTIYPEQIFEIRSTTSGFLPPRMTTAQKDAISPQSIGMVVFDTTLSSLNVRSSTGWIPLTGDVAGPATSTSNAIAVFSDTTGNKITNSSVLINPSGDMVVDTNTLKVDATNNRVGIGTASPSQVFQIDSTTSGFLPPRMTTAQRDAIVTQTPGMVVFDTTLNALSVRNSTGWVSLSGTALLSVNKIDELMDAMKKQQNQITQLTKKIEELEKR